MSSNKKHKHWSDRVHESVVSRNKFGQLNLVIKGGAEETKFPCFGSVKQENIIYLSGKIQDGEILLEVNDQSVVGLTLYDLNNLIKQAHDPVRFKTVKEDEILVRDLKMYLSKRFNKVSVDHQLQTAIRDNLYLRTLPCTTRQLREGELDGVDYTFLSIEQFQELEKSDALLESGVYEGNYYGTPKPPPIPLSPPTVRHNNSAKDLLGLLPSVDGKSNQNSSFFKQERPSAGTGSLAPRLELEMQESLMHSEKILGPLPNGWEMAQTESGDYYFIDHSGKKTSWIDPRLEGSSRKDLEACEDDELPYGWERVEDPQFGVYFVDHIDKKTQFANPVLEAKKKLSRRTDMEKLTHSHPEKVANGTDMHDVKNFEFTSDPNKLNGVCHLVPIEKTSRGFGFTIVGGDDPEEFLQIKSVVSDGSAARTGNIEQGDIIVKVNDMCVLGWTHPDVVNLFHALPIGQIVTLQLCRGYPLLIDSDDLSNDVTSTNEEQQDDYDDKSDSEFERQLQILNSQLEQAQDSYYHDLDREINANLSNPSKSMPDISSDQNYVTGYYGKIDLHPSDNHVPNNIYARSGSLGALPAPVVMQVIIEKSGQGFGFTIADSPQGQRVKQVLDASRCHELKAADILLEINGTAVQNMPHNNVVEILKDCPGSSAAIFVIQRGPHLLYDPFLDKGQNHINGSVPNVHQSYAYPNHIPVSSFRGRMKRSQTEPGLGSENASVVSAPPGSTLGQALPNQHIGGFLSDYRRTRTRNMEKSDYFAPTLSSKYELDGGSVYRDPHTEPSPPDNYINFVIILRREESGFGFRILGGNAQDETVTIGAIVPQGAADKEGTLRTGDELLTVDGQRIKRMGHNQVIALMGNAARKAVVQLGIRRRVGATQIISRSSKSSARQIGGAGSNSNRRGSSGAILRNGKPFEIVINRREQEGFGFVIISSVKTSGTDFQAPHKIGRLIEGSPAARCGNLRVGDRILAVNKVDITQLHHGQIVSLIKDSGFSITLQVLPLNLEESTIPNNSKGDYTIVNVKRSQKGFGFGIRGGREYNMPFYVLRVARDGPAAECGDVRVGDILLEINGRSVVDIPHAQAINMIKQGGATVKLLLKRGDGTVPEIETKPNGSVQSLSSSGVSDSHTRITHNMQFPSNKQPSFLSTMNQHDKYLQKPISSPSTGQPPVSRSSSRQTQNFMRQLRRRANSSGEAISENPISPPALRLRRAITPNPIKAQKETVISHSGSDVGARPYNEDKASVKLNTNPQDGTRDQSMMSNAESISSEENGRLPSTNNATSPVFTPTSDAPLLNYSKTNGCITANDNVTSLAESVENRDLFDFPQTDMKEVNTSKGSLNIEGKKSKEKKIKSTKSRSTKVGLWLSPKKKQK